MCNGQNRTTNHACKRCLEETEFEIELVNADRDLLYKKSRIDALHRQLDLQTCMEMCTSEGDVAMTCMGLYIILWSLSTA